MNFDFAHGKVLFDHNSASFFGATFRPSATELSRDVEIVGSTINLSITAFYLKRVVILHLSRLKADNFTIPLCPTGKMCSLHKYQSDFRAEWHCEFNAGRTDSSVAKKWMYLMGLSH